MISFIQYHFLYVTCVWLRVTISTTEEVKHVFRNYFSNSITTIIIFFSFIQIAVGQSPNSETNYSTTFICRNDTSISHNQTILPGTVTLQRNGMNSTNFELNENTITILCSNQETDTITLSFQLLPFPFHQKIALWDSSQIRIAEGDIFYHPIEKKAGTELIESTGLEYDGALTRGFSVGNNQSLVLDSELNLQLSGNIGDGYEIKAAITDNNLPIQADGTTRQIQEFDKVFIEIKKNQHSILAGDFDAVESEQHFLRYNRKLKGAQYSYYGHSYFIPWEIQTSAAVSRGQFTRQSIIPSEGNQGPYPLRGENGELFIIVLAGSEKVFLDGQLLIRGEDADYVMDYNKSEIIFTRNILINSRHRITIEFEYAQFNFQKSHNSIEAKYRQKNLNTYVHFFQENDSKSVTGDLDLTSEDLAQLQMAGDVGGNFLKSGIKEYSDEYNSNLILYARHDTVVGGVTYEDILEWSTDPQEAVFTVSFSDVGEGNGNYIISPNPSPNGRVYQWVAPDPVTGGPTGNFAPVIPLPAPQQKQMLVTGADLKYKRGIIYGEVAYSRQDLNRYSTLDDQDNAGVALKLNAQHTFLAGKWKLSPFAGYERAGSQFQTIDPYRNPEFARDWNLIPTNPVSEEHYPIAGFRAARSDKIYALYKFEGLYRPDAYNGNRHTGQIHYDTLQWKISASVRQLLFNDNFQSGEFFRPSAVLERILRVENDWRIGTSFFEDRNEVRSAITDTLRATSFIHNKLSFYVKNDPGSNMYFGASYNLERPRLPQNNQFLLVEKVNEWNINGHFHQWKNFGMEYTLKQRDALPVESQTQGRKRTLLGRIDVRSDLLQKALKWSAGYEIGNGQEPKVEFKYVRVQKGEGIYIWIDDGDGIEEVNEFEIAPFADQGEYIRLSVFNAEFINTRSLITQNTFNIDLRQITTSKILSKIAGLSTYQLSRKIREENDSPYWNPFYTSYADTSVLTQSSLLRNILYWNRSSTNYDIQIGQVRQQNHLLQTSGFEKRYSEDLTFRNRISLQKKMDLVWSLRKGWRENRSEFFTSKNYTISQFEAGPEVNVILKDKFRLTASYLYLNQENTEGIETYTSHKLTFESVWRKSVSTDLRLQVSLVNIQYESAGNMNIDFAMLQGLQDGTNVLWNMQFNTRLNKTLILTLQYNGRKTSVARTIHTGSAQIRASF